MYIQSISNNYKHSQNYYSGLKNSQNTSFCGITNKVASELTQGALVITRKLEYNNKNQLIKETVNKGDDYTIYERILDKMRITESKRGATTTKRTFAPNGTIISQVKFETHENIKKLLESFKTPDGKQRFVDNDLETMIRIYNLYPQATKNLASMKLNNNYRFNVDEIEYLAKFYDKGYANEITKYASMVESNGEPSFERSQIWRYSIIDKDGYGKELEELLSIKNKDGYRRFDTISSSDSPLIQTQAAGYGQEIKALAELTIDGKEVFYSYDIPDLVEQWRDGNADEIKYLASITNEDNTFYFGGPTIRRIVNIKFDGEDGEKRKREILNKAVKSTYFSKDDYRQRIEKIIQALKDASQNK